MLKKLIIFFITLSSLELYNLAFLNENVIKTFQLIGLGVIFLLIVMDAIYFRQEGFPKKYALPIILIFAGVFISMFAARWGHDQSYTTTLIAQRFMYFYLLYWALHAIKIDTKSLESIIIWLGVTYSVFYLIQFFVYPNIVFDVRVAEDRGTIRIFLSGFGFLILAYFLTLSKTFKEFTPARIFYIILFLSIIILMGTRQVILSVVLITMLFVLFSRLVKSRILVFTMVVLSLIPLFIIFQDIFISLIDLSKNQSEALAENTRIRSATFFLTQLFPDTYAYYTGNGADSANSNYGLSIQMYKDLYGFYQSDLGIIGDYTKFGVLFVIGVFWILFKIIFSKPGPESAYIKFFFISILLTLFTGGGAFGMSDSIAAVCFTFYLLDIDYFERNSNIEESEMEDEEMIEETYTHYE